MKKGIYLALLTLVTCGCILAGTVFRNGIFDHNFWEYHYEENIKTEYDQCDSESTLDSFNKIDIDCDVMDIQIRKGNSYSYSYKCTEKMEPEVSVNNGKLTVTQRDRRKIHTGNTRCDLYITVPADAKISYASVHTDVGEIEVENVNMEESVLTSDVGDITVKSSDFATTEIRTNVGDVFVKNSSITKMNLKSDTGNVEVEDSTFEGLDIRASVGDVDVKSNKDLEKYSMDLSTNVGEVEINGRNYKRSYNKEGTEKYYVNISGNIGDVELDY